MAALKLDEEVIFNTARKIDTAPLRAEYLQQVCGGDEDLRGRVLALLQAHEEDHGFLRSPAADLLGTVDSPQITERPGTVIGPYELMEQIGEGGFGLVFVAEQQEPVRRKVALKIIKPGMDSGEVIARFEAERQALALMDHPNIARIFDGGTTQSGRPYFVMELVKGIPIIEYCDQQQLTASQRLDLFLVVCQAVQHAHGKGIIHRDLKPSNILVAPHDGVPVVKVIDFGVAKAIGQQLTSKKIYTRFTQMIGTPLYMSPEQAEINALDVDIRSDVYSLGVLLYELLTGTTPFDKERFATVAYDEIRRIIKEEEPPKPSTRLSELSRSGLPSRTDPAATGPARQPGPTSTLASVAAQRKTEPAKLSALVRGDLDWIVMKALEKDRSRRYDTASAMAADVRRFQSDEVVEARPPSALYRFRKMARRNKAAMTTAAMVAAVLLLGIAVSTWQAVRATRAEADAFASADQAAKDKQRAEENAELARSNGEKAEENAALANQAMAAAKKSADLAIVNAIKAEENAAKAEENELTAKALAKIAQHNENIAEWRLYASKIASGQREWDRNNVTLLYHFLDQCHPDFRGWEHDYLYTLPNRNHQTLRGHTDEVNSVAFSPDGKRMASSSWDIRTLSAELKLWDVASGRELQTFKGPSGGASHIAFSPDGKYLARASWDTVKLLDAASGKEIWTLKTTYVTRVAFSPDGKQLAGAGGDYLKKGSGVGTVTLWNTASGKEVLRLEGHTTGVVYGVAFSPDGRRLASASQDKTVKLWELASGKEYVILKGHLDGVTSVAFSPDGKRLASASRDKTVKLWDADSGKELHPFPGQNAWVTSLAFSPDGKRLASASWDKTVKLWDADSGRELQTFLGHEAAVLSVAFSPDGKRLASASEDMTVKLWDATGVQDARGVILRGRGGNFYAIAFSPDGKYLAGAMGFGSRQPGHVRLWDAASGKEYLTVKGHTDLVRSVAFSPDGKRLATASYDKTVKLWDADSGEELLIFQGHEAAVLSVAFSPDGKRLASASMDTTVKFWDVGSGQEIMTLTGHKKHVNKVAFSPDGKRLASVSGDRTAKLWDAESGKELLTIQVGFYSGEIAFSPNGKHLASAGGFDGGIGQSGQLKLWDAVNGQELRTLTGHTRGLESVAFSPDGKRLATASYDKTVRLWDAASGQEVLTLIPANTVNWVAFSPDGKHLAGASSLDGTIIIWDASMSMKKLEQK